MNSVIIHDRHLFMQQAYNALFSGSIYDLPEEVRRAVISNVTQDLVGVIRSVKPNPLAFAALEKLRAELVSATRPN